MNIVPTRLFQDETTDNNEPRSRSLPAPTSGITIDNQPDVYDMTNNDWEDDYDWFDLDEMLAAERGEGDNFDEKGQTAYWSHEIWDYYDNNSVPPEENDEESAEAKELNNQLRAECNIKMLEQGLLGPKALQDLPIYQFEEEQEGMQEQAKAAKTDDQRIGISPSTPIVEPSATALPKTDAFDNAPSSFDLVEGH